MTIKALFDKIKVSDDIVTLDAQLLGPNVIAYLQHFLEMTDIVLEEVDPSFPKLEAEQIHIEGAWRFLGGVPLETGVTISHGESGQLVVTVEAKPQATQAYRLTHTLLGLFDGYLDQQAVHAAVYSFSTHGWEADTGGDFTGDDSSPDLNQDGSTKESLAGIQVHWELARDELLQGFPLLRDKLPQTVKFDGQLRIHEKLAYLYLKAAADAALAVGSKEYQLGFELVTVPNALGWGHSSALQVVSDIPIGERLLTLSARLPRLGRDVVLRGDFDGMTLPSLSTLTSVAGEGSFLDDLPTSILPTEHIELKSFGLGLNDMQLMSLSFRLGATDFQILPGVDFTKVESVLLGATIYDPLRDSRRVYLNLSATLSILDVHFDLAASSPTGDFHATLRHGDVIAIDQILTVLLEPIGASWPDEFPRFEVTDASLVIPGNTGNYSFYLAAENSELDATVGDVRISILRPWLRVSRISSFGPDHRPIVMFGFTTGFGSVELDLSSRFSADGMAFTGTISDDIAIGDLIEWINEKFTGSDSETVSLPKALTSLTIERLDLEFHTQTKFVQFICEGRFQVSEEPDEWTEARITITREIAQLPDESQAAQTTGKTQTFEFAGHLAIDGQKFALKFDSDSSGETEQSAFVASYQPEPAGAPLSLRKMIDEVSTDIGQFIPDSLEISVRDLYLAYYKESAAQAESKFSGFMFGVDLATSVSLSDIPLAGSLLPAAQTAGVDNLRLIAANKDFDEHHLELINASLSAADIVELLRPDSNQNTDEPIVSRGMNVAAELQLGNYRKLVHLTTGGSKTSATKPGKRENGENEVADSPKPDSAQQRSALQTNGATESQAGVALKRPAKAGSGATWINLDKSIGPIEFRRIGLQYQNSELWVLLDVAFSRSGLTLSLDGLGVGSPLSDFKPTFKLDGIGLDYTGGGGIEIGGAFLHERVKNALGQTFDQYSGTALIKTEALKLSAIGSYAEMDGYSSMFVYAFLDKPLGGPAFFFVTGLAAGFGYNRALKSPTAVEEIENFPLVSIAMGGNPISSPIGGVKDETSALLEILSSLGSYVPPAPNKYFLALGIKFTSFKLIDSFALLIATFGDDFRLKLLGISKIVAPPAESGKTPVAEVTIGLLAEFIPDDGLLKIDGKIMPGSYVLDHDCQLTGGFAFYSWFSGPHDGDFVLTVGGYHPRFHIPAHYPAIERLALNWQVNSDLSVKGTTYFALTSSAIMAGGHLEARLDRGNLQAWFDLTADFLVCWQPFHYDISLSIEIGASYHTWLGTISASLSAGVHIWGPEFAGTAHIHFYFVSFSVSFGATGIQEPPALSWEEFKTSFLPPDQDVCTIAVTDGLARTKMEEAAPSGERWVINPKHFALALDSVIPVKVATGLNGFPSGKSNQPLGIGSMEVQEFESTLTVTAQRGPGADKEDCLDDFQFVPVFKSVPSALWGKERQPDLNGKPIPGVLCGFEVRPAGHPAPGDTNDIKCSVLRYNLDDSKPDITRQKPAVPNVIEADTKQLYKSLQQAHGRLKAFFPNEADSFDPFDTTLDQRLIDEFLELPQLTQLMSN